MSENVTSVSGPSPTSGPVSVTTGPGSQGAMAPEAFKTMGELREKAPEVYRLMTEGIMMRISHEQEESHRRIKKMLEDAERDD